MSGAPRVTIRSEPGDIILFIDDDTGLTGLCEQMLSLWGYRPLIANSGPDAVDLAAAHLEEIKAIILDYCMPGMDGREVHIKIREILPEAPIILSSGLEQQDIEFDESFNDLAGFLQKPFSLKGLQDAIAQVL